MKRTRDAFLYLEPHERGAERNFAQCETCVMWNTSQGKEPNRCHILGPRILVTRTMSCGFYVKGPPHEAKLMTAVTPTEAGLVDHKVRCENCDVYVSKPGQSRGRCKAYEMLNAWKPTLWALNPDVAAKGCCNAQGPKDSP